MVVMFFQVPPLSRLDEVFEGDPVAIVTVDGRQVGSTIRDQPGAVSQLPNNKDLVIVGNSSRDKAKVNTVDAGQVFVGSHLFEGDSAQFVASAAAPSSQRRQGGPGIVSLVVGTSKRSSSPSLENWLLSLESNWFS